MTEKLTLPKLLRLLEFELRNTPLIWGPRFAKIEDDKTITLAVWPKGDERKFVIKVIEIKDAADVVVPLRERRNE